MDLTSLDEVERWLSFVVVALPVLATQSPEEGILGRLEHIGLQIGSAGAATSVDSSSGGDSLLNTSMESSSSSGVNVMAGSLTREGGAALKPEAALARFLVQVVGAACSKFHQMVCIYFFHIKNCLLLTCIVFCEISRSTLSRSTSGL